LEEAADFANDLTKTEESHLAASLIRLGKLAELEKFKSNGLYLAHLAPEAIKRFFDKFGNTWFGVVWSEELPLGELDSVVESRSRRFEMYARALADCVAFFNQPTDDPLEVSRARASLEFLTEKLR